MPRVRLTDLTLQRLKPCDPTTTFWDTSLPAFGVMVGKKAKTFIVMRGADRKRTKIGRYPALSLSDARLQAKRSLLNPSAAHESLTFTQAVATYLNAHVRPNYRPRTIYLTERHFTKHCKPLHELQLRSIKPIQISGLLSTLSKAEANNLFGVLRTFFRWCENRDLVAASPLAKLSRPSKQQSRERVLADEELKKIWCAADQIGGHHGAIVKLLMLTGQRRGEIAALRREWISGDEIKLPREICKNGREHTIPIPRLASALVSGRIAAGSLFPARGATDQPYNGWGKAKMIFDEKCGVTDWTLHDLRRTFSTIHARIGTPPHITERLLNHQVGTLTPIAKIYNRYSYMDEMRGAMFNYEQELMRIFSKEKT